MPNFNLVVLAGTVRDIQFNGHETSFDIEVRELNKPTVYVFAQTLGELPADLEGADILINGELTTFVPGGVFVKQWERI